MSEYRPRSALAALRDAHREGHSLARAFYVSPTVFDADMEAVFARSWLYAGHAGAIPAPGDYVRCTIGEDQIILVRGRDMAVRAFFNVCRHRGSLLCLEDKGHVARFTCPYHQWTFATDGSLLSARAMGPEFDRAAHGLKALAVQVVCGLIFINYDPDAVPSAEFAQSVAERFGAYGLDTARIAHTKRYVIDANWKLVVENSRECYHCGVGHPEYSGAVGFVAAIDSPRLAEAERIRGEELDAHVAVIGMVAEPLLASPDRWFHMRRFPLKPGFRSESLTGERVVNRLMGTLPDENVGAMALITLPNFLLETCCDYAMTLRLFPIDARRTEAVVEWLVHADAREGVDYDLATLLPFWRETSEQDWVLCENNQRGVNSSAYTPGPYAPAERGVNNFVNWYLQALAQ